VALVGGVCVYVYWVKLAVQGFRSVWVWSRRCKEVRQSGIGCMCLLVMVLLWVLRRRHCVYYKGVVMLVGCEGLNRSKQSGILVCLCCCGYGWSVLFFVVSTVGGYV